MSRVNQVHLRAKAIHLQMEAAYNLLINQDRQLAEAIYSEASPYMQLLNALYENDYAIAELYKDADIVMHLDGPAAKSISPSVDVLNWLLSSVNKPLTNMIRSKLQVTQDSFKKSLDIQLTGLAPGSILAGFKVAEKPFHDHELIQHDYEPLFIAQASIASIASVPQVITDSDISDEVFELFPDAIDRDIALMTALKIAPTGRNDINVIEIQAPKNENSKFSRLDTNDRVVLRATVAKSPILKKNTKRGRFVGEIRGLDIDKTRLVLRKVEDSGITSLLCSYDKMSPHDAKNLIGKRVQVTGEYEVNSDDVPKLMRVYEIESLPDLMDHDE